MTVHLVDALEVLRNMTIANSPLLTESRELLPNFCLQMVQTTFLRSDESIDVIRILMDPSQLPSHCCKPSVLHYLLSHPEWHVTIICNWLWPLAVPLSAISRDIIRKGPKCSTCAQMVPNVGSMKGPLSWQKLWITDKQVTAQCAGDCFRPKILFNCNCGEMLASVVRAPKVKLEHTIWGVIACPLWSGKKT